VVVDLASGADQTRLLRVLRHDKPRVDGDTVAANARARLQDIDARMAVRQADQLPDVNALVGANQRQLVGKSDVDVAEAVFRQLAHLGGARVGHHAFAFRKILYSSLARAEQTGDMPPITRSFLISSTIT
jgi:hypothetical protein